MVACALPNVSVSVEGNREKISPQPKKTTPDSMTNATRRSRREAATAHRRALEREGEDHRVFAADPVRHPAEEGPRQSVGQAVDGQRERQRREPEDEGAGHAEIARRSWPKCEVTMRPAVDIIDIITNISQKIGVVQHLRRADVRPRAGRLATAGRGVAERRRAQAQRGKDARPPRRRGRSDQRRSRPRAGERVGDRKCRQHGAHAVAGRHDPMAKPRRSGNHLAIKPTTPT